METKTVERLRERITQCGVSKAQLARASGLKYGSNVSAILYGRQYCSAERLAKLASAVEQLERSRITQL
jgi:transcriptional regulator with XRE-family HTH domain